MTEQHIDPHKLNEVLEQILDGVQVLQEKESSASPEFQILMSNYLTKANEAERNQARFEEAVERLELKEQEYHKVKEECDELAERLRSFQRDFDSMRREQDREINIIKDQLSKALSEKQAMEEDFSRKYKNELELTTADLSKQANYFREQFNEMQAEKKKMEQKLIEKNG